MNKNGEAMLVVCAGVVGLLKMPSECQSWLVCDSCASFLSFCRLTIVDRVADCRLVRRIRPAAVHYSSHPARIPSQIQHHHHYSTHSCHSN